MTYTKYHTNYRFDDHTSVPFKLVDLKPSPNFDKGVKAHRHNYYELFVFEKGGGNHLIDFDQFEVLDYSAHIVPPGSVHLLKRGPQTNGYVLLFSRDFYGLYISQKEFVKKEFFLSIFNKQPDIAFSQSLYADIAQTAEQIKKEQQNQNPFTQDLVRAHLNIIILKLQAHFETVKHKHKQKLPTKSLAFLKLLDEQFAEQKQVSFYAQQLELHPDKLNLICKSELGKKASELIKNRICLEVKRLLIHSNLSIKEIAYFLGFEDTAYFSRYVKTNLGATPKVLKTNLLGMLD